MKGSRDELPEGVEVLVLRDGRVVVVRGVVHVCSQEHDAVDAPALYEVPHGAELFVRVQFETLHSGDTIYADGPMMPQ